MNLSKYKKDQGSKFFTSLQIFVTQEAFLSKFHDQILLEFDSHSHRHKVSSKIESYLANIINKINCNIFFKN